LSVFYLSSEIFLESAKGYKGYRKMHRLRSKGTTAAQRTDLLSILERQDSFDMTANIAYEFKDVKLLQA
jgi:hypothetical protein